METTHTIVAEWIALQFNGRAAGAGRAFVRIRAPSGDAPSENMASGEIAPPLVVNAHELPVRDHEFIARPVNSP